MVTDNRMRCQFTRDNPHHIAPVSGVTTVTGKINILLIKNAVNKVSYVFTQLISDKP